MIRGLDPGHARSLAAVDFRATHPGQPDRIQDTPSVRGLQDRIPLSPHVVHEQEVRADSGPREHAQRAAGRVLREAVPVDRESGSLVLAREHFHMRERHAVLGSVQDPPHELHALLGVVAGVRDD